MPVGFVELPLLPVVSQLTIVYTETQAMSIMPKPMPAAVKISFAFLRLPGVPRI